MFKPTVDPAARDPLTKFPLDDVAFDICSMPQEELIAYGETAPVLHSLGGVHIVRLSQTLVLKSGTGVLASEGETMNYVAANFPGVRLPKVYRYFNIDFPLSQFGVKGYIVMAYIDGCSLDGCWDELTPELQTNILTDVADMANQLLSKHFDTPGVIGGGMSRGTWFSDYGAGPFTTKESFEKWLDWKLDISKRFQHVAADAPQIRYPYFVLIHGDLSPRNLVLDAHNQVWLIDWGCAGIYPPIFETASIKHQIQFPDFAKRLMPLVYNNDEEMQQLEGCAYAIRHVTLPPPP